MAGADMQDLVDQFDEFYRTYYEDEIAELAQRYPGEQRSLYIDWTDLHRFDEDLAEDVRSQPDQLRSYAEEALRLFDLPVDISLGQAHVRIVGLPDTTDIRAIRSEHVNRLESVRGIVRKATGVKPKVQMAAFECQRCGTLTRIPQDGGSFQEPHECQGCERKGPFRINFDQSEFIDAQKLRIQESPEGLRGGETPESIDVNVEDDITGEVSPGDSVRATGVLRMEQQSSGGEPTALFDVYMEGMAVEPEDEQFDEMDITREDEQRILELSEADDIYEQMVDSIAPSIFGHERAKLAMVLQLFSGVTKNLPDGSRTRGDTHMLLIGDPGTGKCLPHDNNITLSDGTARPIGEIVEEHLTDPKPVDDGVYDDVSFEVPSVAEDGTIEHRCVTRVWKRESPDQLYRITTQSGRRITTTPSHPLFVQEDGDIDPRTAAELVVGEFLAVPRKINPVTEDQLDIPYRRSKANNAVRFDSPKEWTTGLARLLGYIIAEGYVQLNEDHTGDLRITNNDREILDNIGSCFDRLGLPWTESDSRPGKDAKTIRCTSSEFVSFLAQLEPAILKRSAKQRVPEPIFGTSKTIRSSFLRGYIEGEATVSAKQREIVVSSMSRKLLEGVRRLLISLGIESQLHDRTGGSWRLRISGPNVDRYIDTVGFTTDRKSERATSHESTPKNPNLEVVPHVSESLKEIRTSLCLSQCDCGVPRSTYQHYERGDRNPSRDSLEKVVAAFEERIAELTEWAEKSDPWRWEHIERLRRELNVSQDAISTRVDMTQKAVSYYERNEAMPDGGIVFESRGLLAEEIHRALAVESKVARLRQLVESDVGWDRIASIEEVEPEDDWVYDLEVEGTHNYIAEGIVSHNSALLQYVRNIAPRSVYTSGKGSSAAGLCVTGDTRIETSEGERSIEDIVSEVIPDPVNFELGVDHEIDLPTFDLGEKSFVTKSTSQAWRMPEKLCRKIETADGSQLEASLNTPVLIEGSQNPTWRPITEIEVGDMVGMRPDLDHPRKPLKSDGGESMEALSRKSKTRIRWIEVVSVTDIGYKEVFDLTIPETHNFVANGIVTHNTAAAVRDDFGDGNQWSLEAGALVLADQGIAAVDELDKMNSDDRSALHEGLEAQEISISKAGINATLKARCSLLAAANPTYGRFDQYEPMGEQIDLEPALISRFDLIFTITDQPDEESDRMLAEHILETNYAGELHTQREKMTASGISDEDLEAVSRTVTPAIEPDLFRKYVAFAKQSCYPRMTDEAREAIQDFYVDLRSRGTDEDAPVPVTARKLEALVRLSEASARVRLSDTVELVDAERVIEIVRSCLQDIGVDPETGQYDADVIETGRSKTQRDRVRNLKSIIRELQDEYDEGAPVEEVMAQASDEGIEREKVEHQIQKLKDSGEVFTPKQDFLRIV